MLRLENVARPLASVLAVVPVLARNRPNTGFTVRVTATPACEIGLPTLSVSCTVTNGVTTAPATVLVGCWAKTRWLAEPATLVKVNVAGVPIPEADAFTAKEPTCELAVTEIAATPVLSVFTIAGPEKVTLGPLLGAEKVTGTPGMPLPSASWTPALS